MSGHQIEKEEAYSHDQEHGEYVCEKCILCRDVMNDCQDICLPGHLLDIRDHGGIEYFLFSFFISYGRIAGQVVLVRTDLHPLHIFRRKIFCELLLCIGCFSRRKGVPQKRRKKRKE